MRRASLFMVIIGMTALGFALGRLWAVVAMSSTSQTSTTHSGLTIEKIQPLSSLVTARVDVADIVETTLLGYSGSIKVAILVKGDFLLGTDLSAARFDSVDAVHHTATLVLSPLAAASPRVDHAHTRVFSISTRGLWQLVPGDEAATAVVNRAYAEAQRIVSQAADNRVLLDRSRQKAESVLCAFFEAVGWRVKIRWDQL